VIAIFSINEASFCRGLASIHQAIPLRPMTTQRRRPGHYFYFRRILNRDHLDFEKVFSSPPFTFMLSVRSQFLLPNQKIHILQAVYHPAHGIFATKVFTST
jgi:hypothetical protein